MYVADGDKVYVEQLTDLSASSVKKELFLTVHPTDTGETVTVEDQARLLAEMLNREVT